KSAFRRAPSPPSPASACRTWSRKSLKKKSGGKSRRDRGADPAPRPRPAPDETHEAHHEDREAEDRPGVFRPRTPASEAAAGGRADRTQLGHRLRPLARSQGPHLSRGGWKARSRPVEPRALGRPL